MSNLNLSIIAATDSFENLNKIISLKTRGAGAGSVSAGKTQHDAVTAMKKFTQVLKGEDFLCKAHKGLVEETIQVINGLNKMKVPF